MGAGALIAVQVLLLLADSIPKPQLYGWLIGLMVLSGAGTLGFTNLGMRVAVRASAPAEELYAGSIVEFFVLAIATLLGLLTYVVPKRYTFWFFAMPALGAAIALIAVARFDDASLGARSEGLLEADQAAQPRRSQDGV